MRDPIGSRPGSGAPAAPLAASPASTVGSSPAPTLGSSPASPIGSPLAAPMGRRRALVVIGSSVAGLVLLDACGSGATAAPRGWVPADIDPTTLGVDQPVPVRFAGDVAGSAVAGSAWLVKRASGDLAAFDPRCTHAECAYEWTDQDRFACLCHEAFFDLDGTVLSGPPPRPLDRFGVREADGGIELEVPADFSTPRPKA